jgi:GDP/UDP-N,N'-diacetylbacillosamine 2-epimerase (hydrolysing)
MKKIAIFTTTRAEFGILSPLIASINHATDLSCLLFAGGSHLSRKLGFTIDEIKQSGFEITDTFDYLADEYDSFSLSRGLSIAVDKLARIFNQYVFDFVCIVGDRYELLSIVANAILFRRPIIHIHGGEKSEGVIDEQIRHMITKAAHLHFVACQEYASIVEKLGEPKSRVFNTGALTVDNIVALRKPAKADIYRSLGLDMDEATALMTYHPVTLEFDISPEEQVRNVLEALNDFDMQVVITGSNIEVDRDRIDAIVSDLENKNKKYFYFNSLGSKNYFGLLSYCRFVIGNSSSGILEVPFFRIPTINVGDRQSGRKRHASVIDTGYSVKSIKQGIHRALSEDFRSSLKDMFYEFGDGHAAEKMVEIIRKIDVNQKFLRKKLEFPC